MTNIEEKTIKLVDAFLEMQPFKSIFNEVAELNEHINIKIHDEKTFLVLQIIKKYMKDDEIQQQFTYMAKRFQELSDKSEEGFKRIELYSDDRNPFEEVEKFKEFLFNESQFIEYEILELAYKKLKKDPEILSNINVDGTELLLIPKTKYPNKFISPKDKVSNKLFDGALTIGRVNHIATEGSKSKKELTAKVSIDFDELKGVTISRDLNSYDREVHDAIVSLYVDGGNDYITPLMIYRTMTGNQKAKLYAKQQQAINESVTKCSFAKIRIDAEEEAKAYNMDKLIYEGNLIYTEKIIGIHKGETGEWIHILRKPVLFDYAETKGQIDRADINLLNTPINKNEENIILQGYLLRRIRTMKHSKLSKNILYETIYKQLNVEAASPGALRKKQSKVRDTAKEILSYWKEVGEIKGYKENKGKNNSIVSLTILLD
jgi:hypothetical protein